MCVGRGVEVEKEERRRWSLSGTYFLFEKLPRQPFVDSWRNRKVNIFHRRLENRVPVANLQNAAHFSASAVNVRVS